MRLVYGGPIGVNPDRTAMVLESDWVYYPESVMRLVYSTGINLDRPAIVL